MVWGWGMGYTRGCGDPTARCVPGLGGSISILHCLHTCTLSFSWGAVCRLWLSTFLGVTSRLKCLHFFFFLQCPRSRVQGITHTRWVLSHSALSPRPLSHLALLPPAGGVTPGSAQGLLLYGFRDYSWEAHRILWYWFGTLMISKWDHSSTCLKSKGEALTLLPPT